MEPQVEPQIESEKKVVPLRLVRSMEWTPEQRARIEERSRKFHEARRELLIRHAIRMGQWTGEPMTGPLSEMAIRVARGTVKRQAGQPEWRRLPAAWEALEEAGLLDQVLREAKAEDQQW